MEDRLEELEKMFGFSDKPRKPHDGDSIEGLIANMRHNIKVKEQR